MPALLALLGMVTSGIWLVFGPWLPGGRWVAVHLFTLGVLTPAILGFTAHFGASLLMTADEARPPILLAAGGIVGTLLGVAGRWEWLTGLAATALTAAVTINYVRIRRARKASLQTRWVWMARSWERAHGAFIHGAILGVLMALGLLPGEWYFTARLSHLHVNLLGFGGITLLATSAMFAPMALRTQMDQDAPRITARATKWAATGVTVGVLALLASALGGAVGLALRLLAAAGLGVFAAGATRIAVLLVRTRDNAPSPHWNGDAIVGSICFLAVAAWADVVVVALGAWGWMDPIGVLVIAGCLLTAIVGALGTVAPWVLGGTRAGRDAVRERLEHTGYLRLSMAVAGTVIAAAGAATRGLHGQAVVVRSGWALVVLSVAATIAVAASAARSAS